MLQIQIVLYASVAISVAVIVILFKGNLSWICSDMRKKGGFLFKYLYLFLLNIIVTTQPVHRILRNFNKLKKKTNIHPPKQIPSIYIPRERYFSHYLLHIKSRKFIMNFCSYFFCYFLFDIHKLFFSIILAGT